MLTPGQQVTLEQHRHRVWALCYRMTGDRTAADDLAQESLARVVERAGQVTQPEGFEGWMYRVTTTTCLDWLRRRGIERGVLLVVDPLDLDVPCEGQPGPEDSLLRREDLRLAVLSTLQRLPPRHRAVLILRDVLDRSTEETGQTLGITPANVKVLLHRARAALLTAHRIRDADVPVDGSVVERFARAIENADVAGLIGLLADDVWGIVDDGGGRRRPSIGVRAVSRQWQNALRRYGPPERVQIRRLNGEPGIVLMFGGATFASVHLETSCGRIVSIRVLRNPARLQRLGHSHGA